MKLENLHSPGIWFTCLPTDITTFYLGGGKKVKLDTIFGKTVTILVCFPFQTPENEGMSSRHSDQIFVTDRSCTDILTLIILIGLIIGFVRFLFIYYLYIYECVCVYPLFSSLSLKFPHDRNTRYNTGGKCTQRFLVAQGFLLSIVVQKGDVYRIINGYDDCGNVCGRVTPLHPEFQCLDGKNGDNTKNP